MTITEALEQAAGAKRVERRAISAPNVLNEAFDYARPRSFSRGLRIALNGLAILLISGTASIDEHGRSIHIGDFRAQCRRTYLNITELLEAEGATRSEWSGHSAHLWYGQHRRTRPLHSHWRFPRAVPPYVSQHHRAA